MIPARPQAGRSLGFDARERAQSRYARFMRPMRAGLPASALSAVARGPVAPPRLPGLDEATQLCADGAHELEHGYTRLGDGEARVALATPMPGCTAAMVDWWFGWHAEDPVRYKLWHPGAHVHACWVEDAASTVRGRARYVGRTSLVDEYLGSSLGRFAIRFVAPASLGLSEVALAEESGATAVCARVGLVDLPLDVGYLVHHVRPAGDGVEMRSRFWLGGPHAAVRGAGRLGEVVGRAASRWARPTERDALDLLVHCAEEMAHLATLLPDIHAAHGGE
ncbi:MAG: hypothetical protein R3B40_04415 [Polyangiales bacterium]|nr:hypothetical protein [Myxococcales bacterium]